jgi:hypothetical protein
MKLPIQAPAVLREGPASTYFGARGSSQPGLSTSGGRDFVACGPTTNCAAWTCGAGCSCGTCSQNAQGKWVGGCAC